MLLNMNNNKLTLPSITNTCTYIHKVTIKAAISYNCIGVLC